MKLAWVKLITTVIRFLSYVFCDTHINTTAKWSRRSGMSHEVAEISLSLESDRLCENRPPMPLKKGSQQSYKIPRQWLWK